MPHLTPPPALLGTAAAATANDLRVASAGKIGGIKLEARRAFEVKAGTKCSCNLLGYDLGIGGCWVKVLFEQEQDQCTQLNKNKNKLSRPYSFSFLQTKLPLIPF